MTAAPSRRDLLCFWRRSRPDRPAPVTRSASTAPAAASMPGAPASPAAAGDGFSLDAFYRARAAARTNPTAPGSAPGSPTKLIERERSLVPDVARGVWLEDPDDLPG